MFTVKELKDEIALLPDDTLIYVEADHGQIPYQASFLNFTKRKKLEYDGSEINFDFKNNSKNISKITAILIS